MKKVIIFGATGTVGAYTSLFLKDLGYDKIATYHKRVLSFKGLDN